MEQPIPQTEPFPPPKKSGCLRITCGCLVVLLVGSAVFAFMGWIYLNRWEPGRTAWEHFPPDTLFAMEIHDVKELLDRGMKDRAVLSLLSGLDRHIAALENTLTGESPHRSANYISQFREFYRHAGFAYRVILPNIVGIAASDPEGDEFFIYFRPPNWLRLIVSETDFNERVEKVSDDDSTFYICVIDGWVILSDSETVTENVLTHWRSGASPFGKKAKIVDPHITAAIRKTPAAGNRTDDLTPQSGPLFSSMEASGGTGEVWRGILLATPDTWEILGDYRGDADVVPPSAPELAMKPGDVILPAPPLGENDSTQMRLSAKLAEPQWREFRDLFTRFAGPGTSWQDRGMRWMRQGWLDRMPGNILLTADRPAADATAEVVPAPVLGAGWLFTPGDRQAGADFQKGLIEWAEAALAPGGPMGAFADAFSLNVDDDGNGGVVNAPAVAAYAARPAWRVYPGAEGDMGWLASDPKGLPAEKNGLYAMREAFFTQEEPNAAAFTWDVSEEFLRAGMDFLRDWLGFPVTLTGEEAERLLDNAEKAAAFLSAFPVGTINAEADVEAKTLRYRGRIPSPTK